MAEYHVIATGTGPGSGTEADPWVGFANIPNGLVGGGDFVRLRGTFTPTSALGLPGIAASANAASRVTFRGGYPGQPAVIQCGTGGYLNINRSFITFDQTVEIIGANTQAVYVGINRNYITLNCTMRGTNANAPAVVMLETGAGAGITDLTFGTGSIVTGTAQFGIRWLVFGNTATATTLTNLTIDGLIIQNFVSNRAALELRIDPGAPTGCKITNLIMRNTKAINISGVAWEVSMFREGDLDGFLMEDCECGPVTSILPTGSDQHLGGGLGISGAIARLGVQPTIRRTTFHDIIGVGGGIDTFHGGDYLIEDCDFWNIRSDDGDIDGSAIIADTGTTGMTIRNCRAWDIYGDRTSPPGSYKGGAGLNILQATNVKVESYYMRNVRMAITYGIPLAPQLNPIVLVTVSGSVATVTSQYDLGPDMLATNAKFIWSFETIPAPAFAGTYTFGTNATITGAKTFTVQLASSPGAPPSSSDFGKFTPFANQSSNIRGVTALGCTETAWWIGGLNEKMNNNDLLGAGSNSFNVANPSLPLFVQFYAVANNWTKEGGNFYSGSALQDPYGRYKISTCYSARMGRHLKD